MDSAMLNPARKTSKKCQIEGCIEITVGSRTALCRKHRNTKYKQNYNKKKKRKAHSPDVTPSESIENQLAEEKCLMEQKYASMLQQVLAQKRLELLQSENIIQVLRTHQQKVKQDKVKEIQERKIKKEKEPLEITDPASASSKTPSDTPSHLTKKAIIVHKANSKVSKTPKKNQQNKKSPGEAAMAKESATRNNYTSSDNMAAVTRTSPSSDFPGKTFFTGASIAPSLRSRTAGIRSGSGQTPLAPKSSTQQMTPIQSLTMSPQHIPRIGSVFSYQSASFAKICIDSVKDLSLSPTGKLVTPGISSPGINPKVTQNVHSSRMPLKAQPFQVAQKVILPNRNVFVSQDDYTRQSFQSLSTPCSTSLVTTAGNLASGIGFLQNQVTSYPLLNCTPAVTVSSGQVTTSASQNLQSSQGVLSPTWPDQMMPRNNAGEVQTAVLQDDFLLQILQNDNKDTQGHQTTQSSTSLDHMITDQSWSMSISM
ncbi:uncharacterized protein [Montipora capricornis]|uniref:uncharacterized protein n=1 Tax=Montipora capricornis TaxID=246305 RepID=UPI0035F16E58